MRASQKIKTEISAIQVDNDEGHNMSRWTGNVELHDEIQTGRIVTDLKAGAIGTYYSIQKKPSSATQAAYYITLASPWRMAYANCPCLASAHRM